MSKQEIPIASEWEINQQQKIHIINFNVKHKLFEGGVVISEDPSMELYNQLGRIYFLN